MVLFTLDTAPPSKEMNKFSPATVKRQIQKQMCWNFDFFSEKSAKIKPKERDGRCRCFEEKQEVE
jgi:hypothetical protein